MQYTKVCPTCNQPFTVKNYRIEKAKYCSKKCFGLAKRGLRADLSGRFWSKVNIGLPDECWEWQGSRNSKGYGQFYLSGRPEHANRIAYELTYGPLKDGENACHTCDNPPCCNWHHLWAGTSAENSADMISKGRLNVPKGENHPLSKLLATQVIQMRQLHESGNYTYRALALMFGCSPMTISQAVRKISWKHL